MLAREKWQIRTIAVLERVFDERVRQMGLHGDAMRWLPDGTGPEAEWLWPFDEANAEKVQTEFRRDYEKSTARGELTRMHIVREELAEAFELSSADPEFVTEILQVAALCVQWAELALEDQEEASDG